MGFPQKQVQGWLENSARSSGKPITDPIPEPPKPSKYRNKRVVVDGERFDSKKEAARWGDLKLMEKAGVISKLERQVKFPLVIGGNSVGDYVSDFVYERDGEKVVEDVKSRHTATIATYRLKKKLMKTIWRIDIREV